MIPVRIAVKGFLCYRDAQTISFNSTSVRLWMLAGLNGSGKSAVFDGVTYALFGGHRAGVDPRNAQELIHKDGSEAQVAFDFRLDNRTYRAKRTIRRKAQGGATGTQQLLHQTEPPSPIDEDGRWEAVADTGGKKGFDAWVRDNIGLNFETFTSSVLLMQGRAEKLLSSAPKDRFEVLAGIVDLERYQRLHERADQRRAGLKQQVEVLQVRLDELPPVTPEESENAAQRIDRAAERLREAETAVERRQRLEIQAEQWAGVQTRLAEARRQADRARSLIADAERIDADWARLTVLRAVLPPLKTALEQRNLLNRSAENGRRIAAARLELANRAAQLTEERDRTVTELQHNRQETEALQEIGRTVEERLRQLAGLLVALQMCDGQREELQRLEGQLAALPSDLAAEVVQHQHTADELVEVSQVAPLLRQFAGERTALSRAQLTLEEVTQTGKQHRQEVDRWTQLGEERAALLTTTTARREQADEKWTTNKTLLQETTRQLEQLQELTGKRICRLCAQPLTPGHVEEERQRRETERRRLAEAVRTATAERQSATDADRTARAAREEADRELAQAQNGRTHCANQYKEANAAVQRHTVECGRLAAELPAAYRDRIVPVRPRDWAATTFPTPADLEALSRRAAELPSIRRQLDAARTGLAEQSRLQAQVETARKTLTAQEAGLPADGAALRQEHADLNAADARGRQQSKQLQTQARKLQTRLEQIDFGQQELVGQLAALDRDALVEELRRTEAENALERIRLALPADWREAAVTVAAGTWQTWQTEQRQLEDRDTEAKARDLATARVNLDALDQRATELQTEAAAIPEEARCAPAVARQQTAAARQVSQQRSSELMTARTDAQMLTDRAEKRRELGEQHQTADRLHHRYRSLSELLGRNRLQLHLVRRAEKGIVCYANAILDRLSGGQLSLGLRGDEPGEGGGVDQALQLEAFNRTASHAPIGVAFLSGSQRFRVAVSLALAIGQYASRQHRPIESVIIDEGFGCLDRHGRQVMIQELQNLRDHMRCILLVSHQEEFAEAFPDGYHFELVNGSTRVTPFQR